MKTQSSTAGRALISCLVLAATQLFFATQGFAQQKPEPAAVISIAPLDEQIKDVEYLAKATSEMFGAMSGVARLQAEAFLPGFDFSKPAGVLLYFNEGEAEPKQLGMFPVTNLDDVLDKISEFAEVEEDGTEFTIIPDGGDELQLISKDGYAFISDVKALLGNIPADPSSMLKKAAGKYNIAAEVFPQRVPADLRQQMLDFIKEGIESTMDQVDEVQPELQEAQLKMQMKQMEMVVNDFDKLTIGLNADQETHRVYLDLNMQAKPGSEMAKKMVASKPSEPSRFGGFLMDGAAMTMHNCSGLSKEDAELYAESIDGLRDSALAEISEDEDEVKAKILSKISNRLADVLKKTLLDGTLDMGGAVFTEDGLNAAFAAKVVDARSLEVSIKEIVAESESKIENDEVVFNLNSGSHAGFNLHEIVVSLDVDELDESIEKLFGDKVTIMLAINDDQVYLGAGRNPAASVKKAIDANASAKRPELIGQYNFNFTPIMTLIAKIQPELDMLETMREKIAKTGSDRVRVTYDVVDREMKVRVEIQDGIFQLYGTAMENFGPMGGGGADF